MINVISFREIARRTGMSERTVFTHYWRGMNKLKKQPDAIAQMKNLAKALDAARKEKFQGDTHAHHDFGES